MTDCDFCDIYEKKDKVIYENKHFFSRFDLFPVNPGHAEIIPKKHIVSLTDLTEDEWTYLRPAIKETLGIIESADMRCVYEKFLENPYNEKSVELLERALSLPYIDRKPDSYNHGVNDGEAAGRTVHHLHWHIIPRFKGDVKDPRGGIRHIIPSIGNYRK